MTSETNPAALRQAMARLHTWTGLLFGWMLYAMFVTGAVSYFREEISQWMRPEIPVLERQPDAATSAARAVAGMQQLAPGASQWVIDLADERGNTVEVSWRAGDVQGRAMLDPLTGKPVLARETQGGEFFYYFHFSLHYLPRALARWLVGLATMFMLVALVSGVITHKKIFASFFTFRPGKGQRSWLDAHNVLSVTALPFHLMITYSGLVTLMTLYMPWGADSAADPQRTGQLLRAEMRALVPPGAPSGIAAPLPDLGPMLHEAERRWGVSRVGRLVVDNPGDAASRVRVVRGDEGRVSISPRYLAFDAHDGALREARDRSPPVTETWGVLYGLHVARFADPGARWLFFLSSLVGAAMVATGLVLWTTKRFAKQARDGRQGLWAPLVARLNVAAVAGLPVAMAAFLWGNRLLPAGLAGRSAWEIHLFFIAWGLTLLHAIARPARRAWPEQFATAALLCAVLPLWTTLAGHRFAGFELALLGVAALLAVLAFRSRRA
jgi:uncharacterized iron-regulated membrane protein